MLGSNLNFQTVHLLRLLVIIMRLIVIIILIIVRNRGETRNTRFEFTNERYPEKMEQHDFQDSIYVVTSPCTLPRESSLVEFYDDIVSVHW